MFGYVKVYEDELLVRNWKRYKHAYCALCRQIGCYSQAARMMLSYDMVFCVTLAEAAIPDEDRHCKKGIFRHCKKCCGDEMLQYMGAVSVILQYYKLKDDVLDGKKSRKLLMCAIEDGYHKARKAYPEIEAKISDAMRNVAALEQRYCTDWEQLDHCFSDILYQVFLCAPRKDEFTDIRAQLSRHTAAWVYWFDMLQDLEEDRKEHTFNAILLHEDEDSAISRVKALLIMHITEAEALCELLPYTDNMAIIQNIVANGLPRQMLDAGILL
ncbi:DUF5685 family protein [Faecousia sp. CLA-AA-H192]|jgi:hypothetical protein|uniref:DUF5685 family protein n=1 Tax=Faecousia intestinalis TaxID=3133167 RepID=A0ABV1G9H9_9FIRM